MTLTIKKLKSKIVGKPPVIFPRGLKIRLNVGTDEATIHCRNEEHMQKDWTLKYEADEDCIVMFSSPNLFGLPQDYVELKKGKERSLTTTQEGTMSFAVATGPIGELPSSERNISGDPHIVIP